MVLAEKTVQAGLALKEYVVQNLDTLSSVVRNQYSCGILNGAPKLDILTTSQVNDIRHWFQQRLGFIPQEHPKTAQSFPRLLKSNQLHMATT